MSQPRLLFPLTLATLLACTGDPLADPSATDMGTGTDTGTTASVTGTSISEPTTGTSTTDPTSAGESTSTGDTTGDSTTGAPDPVCGDDNLDAGEECDNGAGNGDDQACTAGCTINVCGDGKVGPGEGCDDGNVQGGDDCSAQCSLPDCGDGLPGVDEECDDGNLDNTDECTDACTAAVCGDGFIQPGSGEACDDGAQNADDQACTAGCTINVCGDAKLGPDEACDDGNLEGGDGCSAECVPPPEATTLQLEFSPIKRFEFSWAAATGATFYQLLESATVGAPYAPIGEDIVGESISLSMPLHLRFGARYVLRACNDEGCADSEPVEVVDSMVSAVGYFKASNTGGNDAFGAIDVELSADGSTLAIGAQWEDSAAAGIDGDQADNTATNAGAVYVFVRVDGEWSQQAYIKASNAGGGDIFGYALALSADGDTLAVAGWAEDSAATGVGGDQADNTMTNAGAVYVFTRENKDWSQQAYIKSSNSGLNDQFGVSVALSADGHTLAVGANSEDSAAIGVGGDQADNTSANAGAAYVFKRAGEAWSQQAYIKASNTGAGDQFGARLILSGDGDTLAVGAVFEDSVATGVGGDQSDNTSANAGAVYVFTRVNDAWSQQGYIKASNTGAGDQFGADITLSDGGDTLAVGVRLEDSHANGVDGDQASNTAVDAGAVYLFQRAGQLWSQEAYIKASNTEAGDNFGVPLVLSADGSTLAVGSNLEDSVAIGVGGDQDDNSALNSGAVYMFARVGQSWTQRAYIKASNTDVGDSFGAGLGLSADGKTLAVGAYREDSAATGIGSNQNGNVVADAGAVYLY